MTEQQRASDEAAQADDQAGTPVVNEGTVEALVRTKLAEALGGKRGMIETAIPTLTFTISYIASSELRLSIMLGVGAALFLGVLRLAQRSSVQYVLTSLFGIGLASVFAMRSGNAEDAFLPGIIYNAVYAVVLSISVLVRWPAIGLMIGPFIGHKEDFTSWRSNPAVVTLASRLTWLLVLPCVIRVLVQYPLWLAETNDWANTFALLGLSKVAMGWPLQVAAFAGMVWLLARGRTPLEDGTAPENNTALENNTAQAEEQDQPSSEPADPAEGRQ